MNPLVPEHPNKLIIEVFGLNVPLSVRLPYTFKIFDAEIDKLAPLLIVKAYTFAVEEIVGELRVPDGITALILLVGTPDDQLPAVAQFVLVAPVHVVVGTLDIEKVKAFDVAVGLDAQAAFEVNWQVMTSDAAIPEPVYVLEFAPEIFTPFLIH